MAAKTTYTCDLCRKSIEPTADANRLASGFAFRWSNVYGVDEKLEVKMQWTDCPIHLCRKCVRAVSNVAAELDVKKLL